MDENERPPKTAPAVIEEADDQLFDEDESTGPYQRPSSEPRSGHAPVDLGQPVELPNPDPFEGPPPMMFPPRQFAATPDVPMLGQYEEVVMDTAGGPATDFAVMMEEGDVDEESTFIQNVDMKSGARGRAPSPVPFSARLTDPNSGPGVENTLSPGLGASTDDELVSGASLVAEIMRSDTSGQKARQDPTTTGRYKPLPDDDFSLLRPGDMKDYEKSKTKLDLERSAFRSKGGADTKGKKDGGGGVGSERKGGQSTPDKDRPDSGPARRKWGGISTKVQQDEKPSTSETKDADNQSGGLASTVGFLASIIRWKTKKGNADTINKNERYPGYLEKFNQLSRELMTSVPFPLMIQIRREALPVVQNIAKAYKSTLGPHHQMTKQAWARLEQLKALLTDSEVFI